MAYRIELSEAAHRDLETILEFLIESYLSLGDTVKEAVDRAAARLHRIEEAIESLRESPHRGTTDPELPAGVRSLTREGAILCFEIGEDARVVRVLAIFLAGQDHRRRMLLRAVLSKGPVPTGGRRSKPVAPLGRVALRGCGPAGRVPTGGRRSKPGAPLGRVALRGCGPAGRVPTGGRRSKPLRRLWGVGVAGRDATVGRRSF